MNVTAVGNSGGQTTSVFRTPYYIPGCSMDSSGNVYTVHNWDETHHDIIKWDANTGANLLNTGQRATPILEFIAVDSAANFGYCSGYIGDAYNNTRTTAPGSGPLLTFGVYKYNINTPAQPPAVAILYNNVNVPFTSSNPVDQQVQIVPINGVALFGTGVYFTDSIAGKVYVYDNTAFTNTLTISGLTLPNGIAVDSSGNIWVGNQHTQISVYNSTGTLLGTPITGLTDVYSLSITGSTLYVGDRGAQNVKTYTITGTPTATLANTFGGPNVPGSNSPSGFSQIRSVSSDPNGNFAVSQFLTQQGNGSMVAKYNSSGTPLWSQYGPEFFATCTYSKQNPNLLISSTRHTYSATRGNPNSAVWTGSGQTDKGSYFGLIQTGYYGRVITLGGHDFYYMNTNAIGSSNIGIYRVVPPSISGNGSQLQFCSALAMQQPGADGLIYGTNTFQYQWSWNGAALPAVTASTSLLTDPGTVIDKGPAQVGSWSWYFTSPRVDDNGGLWLPSYNRTYNGIHTAAEVWYVPLRGLNQYGNPIYRWADAIRALDTTKLLADTGCSPTNFQVNIADYNTATGMLYLSYVNPAGFAGGNSVDSNALAAYNAPDPYHITSSPVYNLTYNSSPIVGMHHIPGTIGGSIVGTNTGTNPLWVVRRYDDGGNLIQTYVVPLSPWGDATHSVYGAMDYYGCLSACQAPDGSLDMFIEDDLSGRVFWVNTPMGVTRFGNSTLSTVSFSNTEVLAIQKALQNRFNKDVSGKWWSPTPSSLLSEINTELSNRGLVPLT